MTRESKRVVDTIARYLEGLTDYDHGVIREFFDYLIQSSTPGTVINNTDQLPEGTTNLYYTTARVTAATANKVDKPQPATDRAAVRFSGTTGAMQNSLVTISDTGGLVVPGTTQFTNTTASTSSTTGSVVFSGGAGFGGSINALSTVTHNIGRLAIQSSGSDVIVSANNGGFVSVVAMSTSSPIRTNGAGAWIGNLSSSLLLRGGASLTGGDVVFQSGIAGTEVGRVKSTGDINATNSFQIANTKVVGARDTGWTAATGTALKGAFDTATATTTQNAQRIKAIEDALRTHGLIN